MKQEKYTLITGSSEGFGKALAVECAKRKMNLVLVALPGPELDNLVLFLQHNYNITVKAIGLDLSREKASEELYQWLIKEGISINMLINNAGLGSTHLFSEGNAEKYEKQVKLNILATTLLTYKLLPLLKAHRKSYLLNVSSMATFFHLPRKCVYGATKSFIYYFSRSLAHEERKNGVQVTVLCPGGMNTNLPLTMMNGCLPWFSRQCIMEPGEVAFCTLEALLSGRKVIVPGRCNRLFILANRILPTFFKSLLMERSIKNLKPDNPFAKYLQPAPVVQSQTRA